MGASSGASISICNQIIYPYMVAGKRVDFRQNIMTGLCACGVDVSFRRANTSTT